MLGTVQFGALAACIVLFVPMGLTGYHLSRNKMLFFSGALFITLAVGVHLTPYFPSITNFMSSLSSVVVLENQNSCISFLNEIIWDVKPISVAGQATVNVSLNFEESWTWAKSTPVIACGFQKLSRSDASDLLNGSWVVVAGDSQARLVVLWLLNFVLEPSKMEMIRGDLFKRHSDFQTVIEEIGVKLDFVWAPYPANLTNLLLEFKQKRRYPDVLVMGSGLWHMLHVTNASDYGVSLGLVRKSVMSLLPVSSEFGDDGPVTGSISIRSPHMFWLGVPTLIASMLNTEEKREKMNFAMTAAYERELYDSKLLLQNGGPLLLLDIRSLSRNCGARCTVDGMHYDGAVYEAAIHIMLNALLIESQERR
ncbi:PC-Esterase [Macleaya cordata]|uniref:PC-Esterase n=1 Tax=Macleaya cordata TaxID=56857 RepID=A0A200PTL6_MACCD|nr:PC-Esterase [Macleaya cordata]